jgi:beta-glucanase (GH16 family)
VGNVNGNVGTFDPNNVTVGSELVLSLTQIQQGSKILSSGSEVMSKQTFGYGTFEFTSRVVNVLSGSDSSGFLYTGNSETEIDMEQVGNKADAVDCTNWHGVSNFQDTQVFGFDQGNSHDFKIVWQPSFVDWYVDGQLVVHHTQAVPSAPAPFLFNMWGTNDSSWGGTATIGPTRYMYISNFSYSQ